LEDPCPTLRQAQIIDNAGSQRLLEAAVKHRARVRAHVLRVKQARHPHLQTKRSENLPQLPLVSDDDRNNVDQPHRVPVVIRAPSLLRSFGVALIIGVIPAPRTERTLFVAEHTVLPLAGISIPAPTRRPLHLHLRSLLSCPNSLPPLFLLLLLLLGSKLLAQLLLGDLLKVILIFPHKVGTPPQSVKTKLVRDVESSFRTSLISLCAGESCSWAVLGTHRSRSS